MNLLEVWESLLLGGSMVVLLFGTGLYLTIRFRFFQIRSLPFICKNTVGTLLQKDTTAGHSGITPFQAMTTALAGTMGVGNIAGVGTALVAGGPGAIFWMWVSAFFGMAAKYAEIALAVKFRKKNSEGRFIGGPMYYIEQGMRNKWLAFVFAALCTLASFGIGNMTQVNAASASMLRAFGVPPLATGVGVAALAALVVWGGVKRIASFTEWVIPFISILYISSAAAFLWIRRDLLPETLLLIVRCAFVPQSAAAGALGYTVSQAVRFGLSRGVFTNEAGLGSAPIAHAAADCKSPAHQGVWGVFEVFLDTIVVCTLTALVILTAQDGTLWQTGLDGALLTSAAFESAFGSFGGKLLGISILFYAVSGMLGWYYYGESSLAYLTSGGKAAISLYRLMYLCAIVVGAVAELGFVWRVSDILNALMAIPNVCALLVLHTAVIPHMYGKRKTVDK